jgi:hypothetical protein
MSLGQEERDDRNILYLGIDARKLYVPVNTIVWMFTQKKKTYVDKSITF